MTHYCTACSSKFEDDGKPLPNSDCVHCVFCGARIALRRTPAQAPPSVVPFSRDYEREEAFALGVISGAGPGFPDTLRQFRVPSTTPNFDSLTPLAHGSEVPDQRLPRAPRKLASLSLSLSVGFGVGVALAFAFATLRSASPHSPAAASPGPAPRAVTSAQPTRPAQPPAPALVPAATPRPAVAVVALATPRVSSPVLERRWVLERARSEQRQYHLSRAEDLYRQILQHAPHDSEALSGLGELELLRGTTDLADAHFQAALSANADYIPARIAAADIRWQSGQVEAARRAYLDIVDRYSADAYPPYVMLRSSTATFPACEH